MGVIVGHAYTISPQPPLQDGVQALLGFDYSGSLAVKFFFFLSGILVTNSMMERPRLAAFLVARCFRLFPGLIVCVVFTAVVVGGIFTLQDRSEYFRSPLTGSYVWANITLRPQWFLPGLFEKNPSAVVNGSLWTLPIEFFCYMLLAGIGAVGLLRSRLLATVIFLAAGGLLVWNHESLRWFGLPSEAWMLPLFFCFGAAVAANKEVVMVDARTVLGLALITGLLHQTPIYPVLFCLFLFFFAFYISSLPNVRRISLPGDFSYGVYLYGFPAQQVAKLLWPGYGVHFNQFVGILLAVIFGAISWYLVEKPAMKLGRSLQQRPFMSRI
ncbi:acyltransferase [soil metagenome]